jgi:hypothetical protein
MPSLYFLKQKRKAITPEDEQLALGKIYCNMYVSIDLYV